MSFICENCPCHNCEVVPYSIECDEKIVLNTYLAKVNNMINDFVKQFSADYSAELGSEFYANMDLQKIVYPLVIGDKSSRLFHENFASRFPCANQISTFLLSLLHEIGHLETESEMVDDTPERNKEMGLEYFDLWNERIATDFAGFWLQDNFEIAKKYNDEIENVLFEMYEKVLTN